MKNAARYNTAKVIQISADVKCKSVHGNPAGNSHADGQDLFRAPTQTPVNSSSRRPTIPQCDKASIKTASN